MNRWAARHLLVLAAVAACNKDKAPDSVPVGDTTKTPAVSTTPAQPQGSSTRAAPPPAPARPADPNAAASAELASATRVRTVQVAAFPTFAAADWWAKKLQGEGIPAYATTTMVNGQEVSRLRIGVALSAAEAQAIAAKIHARYQWPTWITMVEDRSAVNGAMLNASRAYAGR